VVLLAVLAAFAAVLAGCSSDTSGKGTTAPATHGSSTSGSVPAKAPSTAAAAKPTKLVKINSLEGDGSTWGVGMPIILRFKPAPKSSAAFTKAAKVTVNGRPANGAWFWEKSGDPSFSVEAHYRPRTFWPGHATIKVDLPVGGLSAGPGLSYSDKLTSITMKTGPSTIGTVNGSTSKLTITTDGKTYGEFPVALGAPNTPTLNGTKVLMYKGRNERMIGSGYDEIVPWSMRLTNSGEYLHAASWNVANIQAGRPSSNGCTNMLPADAERLFGYLELGTPVTYTNVPGNNVHTVPSWDGYGDWNLPWGTWAQGGLLLNH
jgi:lipoprotein-anchoring transpeptidase ErfK/SrfK